MFKELEKLLESKKDKMIEIRRHLHENPELSFKEHNTAKYIQEFYKDKDCKVYPNLGGCGLKVVIDSNKPGKTIALRADFDALPVKEDTNLEFCSKNEGVMHACGHDAHTAYLMVLAECLIELKDKLKGKIVIIHQHAEETPPGGAKAMIENGVLDGVDNVFGIHVMSQFEFGNVFYHKGETQQARAKFIIKVKGTGGHGSSPHEANDSIVAASHIVVALQTIVSRRLSPFESGVVTIGSFDGKGTFNIIKDSVTLEGDVRCMSDKVAKLIEKEVTTIAKGVGAGFSCDVDVEYIHDYPVLINDDEMTQLVIDAIKEYDIKEIKDVKDCGPQAPSEDFSYYTRELPSCFFYVGAAKEGGSFPHHHPKFDINEDSMMISAKAMAAVVCKYFGL